MFEVYCNELKLHSDFLVYLENSKKLIMANLIERSKYAIQAAIANIYKGQSIHARGSIPVLSTYGDYTGYIQGFQVGKTNYYQGLVKSDLFFNKNSKILDKRIMLVLVENEHHKIEDILYDAIYELHDLPLLEEWKGYIYAELSKKQLTKCVVVKEEGFSYVSTEGNQKTDLGNWQFHYLNVNVDELDELISRGIASGYIKVADTPQKPINVKSIDSYFQKYGSKVVENVLKSLEPKLPRISTINYKAKEKIPFPVQAEVINGIVNHLKEEDYIILNGGMGVGKTFISSVSVAMSMEKSRTILLGPGHMLEKWKEEILSEIHDSKVEIIRDFDDVTGLSTLKGTEPTCKEFYLFSKDFAKLSYETVPAVTKSAKRYVPLKKCKECSLTVYDSFEHKKCSCGSTEFDKLRTRYRLQGAICPECSELVFQQGAKIESKDYRGDNDTEPVAIYEFNNPTNKNAVCSHCGTKLWQPNVRNINVQGDYSQMQLKNGNKWAKIKVARNKSNRTFKTEYILMDSYLKEKELGVYDESNHSLVSIQKTRRYAPAKYIKKVLGKDFFDFGIFDEVHLYKSGDSAQGNAFGQLLKSTKKALALTGTLAGGVASDLFYLLYRLDPKLMRDNGYSYDDSFKFASEYGVVEETREFENETVYYNKTSCGRMKGSKKILPGISPLLFSKMLINNTIFLDLSDFDTFLPKLMEYPVPLEMERNQSALYRKVRDVFREHIREKGGKKLLGQFLPTLMSLPDVNQLSPIIHPTTGDVIFNFTHLAKSFTGEDGLLNKERKLIEIVEKELSENRNCFVYCDFTSDGEKNITERLKTIIEDNLGLHGQVEILKAASPSAIGRMKWIREKAASGIKVFITNPRLVETGRALVSA